MSRETIAAALFALLNTATMKTTFKTISRRPTVWDAATDMPALYLAQPNEGSANEHGTSVLLKNTMNFDIFIYINAGLDPTSTPDTQLNNCLDALEAALTPTMPGMQQTLGGLVVDVFRDGEIIREPGYMNGQGAAWYPIQVLVP